MLSLSDDNQYDFIEAFNSTSRFLDDLLNTDNNFVQVSNSSNKVPIPSSFAFFTAF